MQKFFIISCFVAVSGLFSQWAQAAGKDKPAVCLDFEVSTTRQGKIGVCYDGKKPVVYSAFTVVDVERPEGKSSYMLGWR